MDTVDYTSSPFKISAFIGGSVSQHAESDKLGHDIEVIIGSVFNDSITNSTSRPMKLVGGAGDDTISGGSGNDTIDGGTGHDSMKGNGGKDVFVSDDGEADTINGGSGADSILSSDSGLDVVTNVP
jgi:Ca2+-binding RTX toxin-like protein